jgi:hypothetical protein
LQHRLLICLGLSQKLGQPISGGIVHAGRKSPKCDLDQLAEPAFREMGLR